MTATSDTDFNLIRYERQGSLALITLNRPDKLNAINAVMVKELGRALDTAEADPAVRVIVLNGEGRAFSAGFDLGPDSGGSTAPDAAQLRRTLLEDLQIIMRFWDCPKPTVAAVHRYCLGSAMEMAIACDITIATDDCRFGAPEVRFGSGIVALLLPWFVGPKVAKELLLTGDDQVSAERAVAIGLVNRVVPAANLIEEAHAIARTIAANDEVAVKLTKLAINRSCEIAGFRQALQQALDLDVVIESTETDETRQFREILRRDGTKAALAWRAGRQQPHEASARGPA
jgi:enoyl-CoA hydratase